MKVTIVTTTTLTKCTAMTELIFKERETADIPLTETLHPAGPRANSGQFSVSNRKEIEVIITKETWKVVKN